MTSSDRRYRQVAVGSINPDAVTVGIESVEAMPRASIWWESKGDIDADEAEFDTVDAAFDAAEAARALHGFAEIVVVLAEGAVWRPEWGVLGEGRAREPIGDLRGTGVSEDEAFVLARGIEAERDA
jgi:hypothetical protein